MGVSVALCQLVSTSINFANFSQHIPTCFNFLFNLTWLAIPYQYHWLKSTPFGNWNYYYGKYQVSAIFCSWHVLHSWPIIAPHFISLSPAHGPGYRCQLYWVLTQHVLHGWPITGQHCSSYLLSFYVGSNCVSEVLTGGVDLHFQCVKYITPSSLSVDMKNLIIFSIFCWLCLPYPPRL